MSAEDIIGYVATGERPRLPQEGEHFLTSDGVCAKAHRDYKHVEFPILRPIPRGSVVIEPGLARQLGRAWNRGGILQPVIVDLLAAIDAQTAPPQPVPAPCPECGNDLECDEKRLDSGRTRKRWSCSTCGVSGPWKPTEAAATESWNRFAKGGAK